LRVNFLDELVIALNVSAIFSIEDLRGKHSSR